MPSSTGTGADPWPGVSAGHSAFFSGKFAAGSLVLLADSSATAERCVLGATESTLHILCTSYTACIVRLLCKRTDTLSNYDYD
eukprot:COSAG02_NODE_27831_length_601_cov_5.073705_1_plen_82_part_01